MLGKRGKLLGIVSLLLVFAALSGTTGRARAGSPPTIAPATVIVAQQAINSAAVEPIADGTKNPSSISDEVALRVLLLTNPSDTAHLKIKLGRMHLDEADMTILLQELGSLNALATPQRVIITAAREAEQRNPTAVGFENLAAADRKLDVMAADTYRRLLGSLSPSGMAKLQEHVAYIKTKVKVMPPPNMATHHH
jgi:hypothetical protein